MGGTVTTQDRRVADLVGIELAMAASIQFALLLSLWVLLRLQPAGWLAGIGYAAGALVLLAGAAGRTATTALGPANRVTLARAILVGGVTALVVDTIVTHQHVTVLVVLATVALVLDAVDGQVARRTGTVTALGARFDMEVDAFLILVLSVFVSTAVGAWVLSIGAMRYAFVVAGWLLPWLRSPLPASMARKAVAASQGVALVVAGSGLLPHVATTAVVALALALLAWSFGRDVWWLWRRRRFSAQR
jgi:phosphatidylglycerophosphate synthase